MFIPKEEVLEQITKKLDDMQILLGDEVSDLIAIMCTYGDKQWSGYAKVHIKNVQEDGVKLLQGLRPFIIRLSDNKMHKTKFCKSYDIIVSSEMLSIKITSESIKEKTWYAMYDEMINKNFKRGLILKLYMLGKLITTTMHVLLPLARSKLPIFVKIKSPLVMSV